jgi:autotransporter-associated beta strand protein
MKQSISSELVNSVVHPVGSCRQSLRQQSTGSPIRLCLLLLVISACVVQAQTNTNSYTGLNNGAWTTAGNWSLGVAPNSNQAVVISNATAARNLGSSAAAYSVVVGGASGTSTLGFDTAGNALAVATDLTLAPGAGVGHLRFNATSSSLTLNGGSGSILRGAGSGEARLEFRGGFAGSLGLSSATVDNLLLAGTTTGQLNITNGQTYNVSDAVSVTTATSAGATGVLNVAGGVLNMGGASPAGTVTGELVLNSGNNAANTATVNLSEGGSIVAKAIRRANAGAGAAINWADGTIGTRSDTGLTLSSSAGTLDIFLAGTGTHTFNAQSNRTITVESTAVLANKTGEQGTLTKTGAGTLNLSGANTYSGGTTINAGTVLMNNNAALGSGMVTMNAGTTLSSATSAARSLANNLVIAGDVSFNQVSGGTGQLNLSATNIDLGGVNRRLTINTIASVTQDNALVTTAGYTKDGAGRLNIGLSQNYSGSTILEAGTLSAGNNGAFGTSTLVLRGGTLAGSSATARTFANAVNIEGDVVLTEAVDRTGAITLSGAVNLGNAARTLTVNTDATLSGVVGGTSGGLTKAGNGTLTLTGNNTYTGATTVSSGTLLVDTGASVASSTSIVNGGLLRVNGTAGSVTVNGGGSLGGSGTVDALTLGSGGLLNPGNSPGTLTAASAIVLGGSTYNWQISALEGTAGTNWDLLSVTGLLNMTGVTSSNRWNLVITGDGFTGWTGTSEYSYVFAQAVSVSGFSATVGTDVTSLFNITASGITSLPNVSSNPDGDFKVVVGRAGDLTTLKLMAIPEPSTGSLLGFGFAGLVVTRLLRRGSSR